MTLLHKYTSWMVTLYHLPPSPQQQSLKSKDQEQTQGNISYQMLQHRKWYCMTYYSTDDVFSTAEHSRIYSRERHTSGDWMAHQPWEQHFQSLPSLCVQVDTLFLGECANSFFPPVLALSFFPSYLRKLGQIWSIKLDIFWSQTLCVYLYKYLDVTPTL